MAKNDPHPVLPQGARAFLQLLRAAWAEYERDYARYYAVALVYYALVSLVPLLLLLLATLGLLLHFSGAAAAAANTVLNMVEASFGEQLRATLERLLERLSHDSVIATSISLVGLLVAASALFKHLRLTFRAIWHQAPLLAAGPIRRVIRATFLEQMIAFLMVLSGGALLVATFMALAILQWVTALFAGVPILGDRFGWLLAPSEALLLAPLAFALLFKYLPPQRLRWRHVWLAALLSGSGWLLGAEILALYGANFGASRSAYGVLGMVLVVMLLMNIVSQMLFFCGELCKVIFRAEQRPDKVSAPW